MLWLVVLGAALTIALGNIFQKKGHSSSNGSVGKLIRNFWWVFGVSISIAGTVLYNYALARPDWSLTLVQSLMVFNPVFTALMGVVFLKEALGVRTKQALVMTFIAILLFSMADPSGGDYYQHERVNGFILSAWGTALFCYLFKSKELSWSIISGIFFGLSAVLMRLASLSISPELRLILDGEAAFSIAVLPALLTNLWLWLYGVAMIIAFVTYQLGLARGRAGFIAAFSSGMALLVSVFAGMYLFGEGVTVIKICGVLLSLMAVLWSAIPSRGVVLEQ